MKVAIQRLVSGDEGTFGVLTAPGFATTIYTGELPWRENNANVSCIPAGLYHCTYNFSARFRRNLYILNPTDPRTGVRIHAGNMVGDISLGLRSHSNGCILLGEKLGWINGQRSVLISQSAIRKLEDFTGRLPFDLEILNVTTIKNVR